MIFRKPFKITGVANKITYDEGIKSTAAEKRRVVSVHLLVNQYADNEIQAYHEKANVMGIPDRLVDLEADTFNTNVAKPGARINEIEVGLDLIIGETYRVAISCGATVTNVHGFYAYELVA